MAANSAAMTALHQSADMLLGIAGAKVSWEVVIKILWTNGAISDLTLQWTPSLRRFAIAHNGDSECDQLVHDGASDTYTHHGDGWTQTLNVRYDAGYAVSVEGSHVDSVTGNTRKVFSPWQSNSRLVAELDVNADLLTHTQ